MNVPRAVMALCRIAFLAFLAVSSFYCVLAFVPFTWNQVIQGNLIPQLSAFARLQRWLFWLAWMALIISLLPSMRESATRRRIVFFLTGNALFAVFLAFYPVLASLHNDVVSVVWAVVFLIPLPVLAGLEGKTQFDRLPWASQTTASDARAFWASCAAAIFVSALFAVVAMGPSASFSPVLAGYSFASHLALFLMIFAGVVGIGGISSFTAFPARLEFVLYELFAGVLFFLFLEAKVFPSMSFTGVFAVVYGVALSVSLTSAFAGLSLSLRRTPDGETTSGLALLTLPATFAVPRHIAGRLAAVLAMAVAAYFAESRIATFDWNFVLQECFAVLVWSLAFAMFFRPAALAAPSRGRAWPLLACVVIATAGYRLLSAMPDAGARVEHYAGANVSFKLAREMLSTPQADRSVYDFLSKRTNIGRSIEIKPVNIDLVSNLRDSGGAKPNIFIVVIDSLRRDYLSPYNPKVTFTPAAESFARESVTMRNAFTHYGGTGLAEPSIWVGGMMIHRQYVTPFYPMNTLAKLLIAEHYRSYVSMDNILETVVPRSPSLTELDSGRLTMDYDLCRSLDELDSKVQPGEPVFAYTQAQNIHISVIAHEGKSVPPGETYPGFYAPYASRLHRIDACFGKFIDSLKRRGLYESSIVILTADHGDSLGEGGRFGHAYTIYPEIVRIPMIVHLPQAIRSQVVTDTGAAVFSTDIVPSLYYLLGHRDIPAGNLSGRPLFTQTSGEQLRYLRNEHLIVASYAAVYGLLSRSGSRLFISDAVNERDYLYDLTSGEAISLSSREQIDSRKKIEGFVDEIDDLYHFHPVK